MQSFYTFLGGNDLMAPRLVELRRMCGKSLFNESSVENLEMVA